MADSLSQYELELVNDANILLVKNTIIQKVYQLFGDLSQDYKSSIATLSLPVKINHNAKIARGENYEGLPYVMLDYPRFFSKTDVFAVRTFFWWGNFFSLTLHLEGVHLLTFADSMQVAINKGLLHDWNITSSPDKWQHHFHSDYYVPFEKDKNYDFKSREFIKVATKIPLKKWDDAKNFLYSNFLQIMEVLSTKLQSGETNL